MDDSTRRLVVLGKTGAGKSSLSNMLLGESSFTVNHSPKSGTIKCDAKTKSVNGKSIKLVDTPGLFDTERSEEDMKTEILNCMVECAPGPHAFIVVMKVEKYTEQEKEIIKKITEYFNDDALKFATVLFTHGDQLQEGETIEEFVSQSGDLKDLVKKCGDRCHVVDNKYWKNSQDEYRSNEFQVKELFNTMDRITEGNNGRYYTNEALQALLREIEKEKESIQQSCPNMSTAEILEKAKSSVIGNLLRATSELKVPALLSVFFGGAMALASKGGIGSSSAILGLTVAFGIATGAAATLARSVSRADEAKVDEGEVDEAKTDEGEVDEAREDKAGAAETEGEKQASASTGPTPSAEQTSEENPNLNHLQSNQTNCDKTTNTAEILIKL